jgi:hypothetical protein
MEKACISVAKQKSKILKRNEYFTCQILHGPTKEVVASLDTESNPAYRLAKATPPQLYKAVL